MSIEKHLIPELILDLVENLKKANPSAQLTYLKRLETIRDYISLELSGFELKGFSRYGSNNDRKSQKKTGT